MTTYYVQIYSDKMTDESYSTLFFARRAFAKAKRAMVYGAVYLYRWAADNDEPILVDSHYSGD
jgi:hypothetical protein